MAQHHITGEFHMPVVLRQFFVTLEHDVPLRPGPYVGLTHGLGEGEGLIATDVLEVFSDLLLQFVYRLPYLGNCPLGAKFGLAIAMHLAPGEYYSEPVVRQPYAVGQNHKRCVRVGHIVGAQVDALVSQGFDDVHHPLKRPMDIGQKLLRGYSHPPPPREVSD